MKFKNRYRIESARLSYWDYSSPGLYFVTVCTKFFEPYFGKIDRGFSLLNELGQTVFQYWSEIPQHHKNIAIDEFIVMPNHIHGIIVIVETLHATSLQSTSLLPTMSSISPRKGSLGVIIRSFKSGVTRWARMNSYPNYAWQP